MNKLKKISIALFATILLINIACTSKKQDEKSTKTEPSSKAEIVKTLKIKKETINQSVDYTSSLMPFEEIHLAPSSPGRIEKINVEISDNVKQGQILVQMDRTQLQQAKINMLTLETDYKRFDTLIKTKSIAQQQYDQLKSRYDIAKSSYDFLLENTQLKAPFNGIISGKYFENGEMYSGSPIPSIGKPAVISIIQISSLKAQVNISASYFPLINLGMKAVITSDLYPGKTYNGEIFRIYPTIDNTTKTFTVEVKIQNDNLKLRPGMFSKIQLNLGKGSAILIPVIALIKQTGTNDMYVFINKNNKAIKTAVKTGRMIDDKIEIIEGLNEGDEIVTVGQNKLENQKPIIIK
ncbi:MAG: efflux RND transporter periplasmic adaptor subunit [Bacteroidales bacterium]|nr:efflux RND transporter periplasmic adaptor subunit [Bacteroidales bacterium]